MNRITSMQRNGARRHTIGGRANLLVALLIALALGASLMPVAWAGQFQTAQPAQRVSHRVFLPLVTAGAAGHVQPGWSARELIEAALKAGAITHTTALLYKAQAVLDDPALPAQFRGTGVGDDGPTLMREVRLALPTLSAVAQAQLRPYLLAPSSPESWYARSVMGAPPQAAAAALAATALTWRTVDTTNGKAKVWYHPEIAGDAARAQQLADAIDGRIWQKLAELFGRELPPDCGAGCVGGGGDGRTDVYLLDRPNNWSGIGTNLERTGYVVLGRGSTLGMATWLLASVWTDSIPVADEREYAWLKHAAAAYAIHYVYPTINEEHRWADDYMTRPDLPLEGFGPEAYLFFFGVEGNLADQDLVRRVFANAANPNSLAALDAALDGKLDRAWSDFALSNWNTDPMDVYSAQDQLTALPAIRRDMQDQTLGARPFPIAVPHLATDYYHFAFSDLQIRTITFTNPIARDAVDGGHVWAVVAREGEAWMEDWGEVARRTFCRDTPTENITNVFLIVSNGQWRDRDAVMETEDGLVESEAQCGADLTGTITWNRTFLGTSATGSTQEQATATIQLRVVAACRMTRLEGLRRFLAPQRRACRETTRRDHSRLSHYPEI